MAGSDSQAAFYYQNIVAAISCLDLIEFGSPIASIQLENPERGKHVDDVIVDHRDGVRWCPDARPGGTAWGHREFEL